MAGAAKAQGDQKKTKKSKLTPGEQAAISQGFMLGSPLAAAGGEALGTAIGGSETDSAGEAFGKGALSAGLGSAATGAGLGMSFGPGGALIGAGVGLLAGGLVGGLQASKEYDAYEKTKKATEKLERQQKAAAASEYRRQLGREQQDVSDAYLSATPAMEMVDNAGGGVSSYDAYKRRTFGG